ncbi:phage-related protein [Aurantimicrobium minutum]|nr:phage-related protein [Aurantimicrobium minutum]
MVQELRKIRLSEAEQHSVERTLMRISRSESLVGDVDYLGRDIWEVRVRLERRILRLLYFMVTEPPLHIVVLAAIKKTPKTPPAWIDLAISRKHKWLSIDG